jgi:hypothetical protein
MRLVVSAVSVALGLTLLGAPSPAQAFERQWHLGAGFGTSDGHGLKLSPTVGVYGAYGISDVFDVRLEVTARGYHVRAEANPNALSAMLGLCYKLDVLSWVPWAGVYAGYLGFDAPPRPELLVKQHDAALGLGLGLDYGWSRNFGVGLTLHLDQALSRAEAASFDALLRAEYRWGW